jgi:lysozyme
MHRRGKTLLKTTMFGGFAAALALTSTSSNAQTSSSKPWLAPNPILVLDPYESNEIDWEKLSTDKVIKAVIHRAFFGLTPDRKYVERVAEAKKRGLLAGIYLLGRPGDPLKQADALVAAGAKVGVTFLALDIENMDPKRSMTISDAARFMKRVHERTGRYPAFYTNFSTYQFVSRTQTAGSVFGKTPLWLARFRDSHGMSDFRVWKDYTIWQFQSEINCLSGQQCPRRVPGTASDMDVNVFRGGEEDLRKLFSRE